MKEMIKKSDLIRLRSMFESETKIDLNKVFANGVSAPDVSSPHRVLNDLYPLFHICFVEKDFTRILYMSDIGSLVKLRKDIPSDFFTDAEMELVRKDRKELVKCLNASLEDVPLFISHVPYKLSDFHSAYSYGIEKENGTPLRTDNFSLVSLVATWRLAIGK